MKPKPRKDTRLAGLEAAMVAVMRKICARSREVKRAADANVPLDNPGQISGLYRAMDALELLIRAERRRKRGR